MDSFPPVASTELRPAAGLLDSSASVPAPQCPTAPGLRLSELPAFLRIPRVSARAWVAIAVALGCAVAAYAGMYPRFDDGRFRIALALTCAPFGAVLAAYAVAAKTRARAFFRALLMSGVLGVAATVVPGFLLAKRDLEAMPLVLLFGAVFGFPTGAVYGVPIAVLASVTQRRVVADQAYIDGFSSTADRLASNDRVARVAGGWLALGGIVAAFATWELDVCFGDSDREPWRVIPFLVAIASTGLGLAVVARAWWRLRKRTAWVARVQAALEPGFRLRPVDVRDDLEGIPRLGIEDVTSVGVVEACGNQEPGSAYRVAIVPLPALHDRG
ncbi:MAG: hypothetical protein JST00_03620 [Deltaproteobacteria bacterium]|nr:hypothetical protein [Deltaproteobacteria bacterium]